MNLDFNRLGELAIIYGINGLGALTIGFIGWWAASFAERLTYRGLMVSKHMDRTVAAFVSNLAKYAVIVVSFVLILQVVGIQATSLVAVLGAASLAVGLALQGTLSNMAAGVMLLLFRPFRIGDNIEVGGRAGTVRNLNLFMTELMSGENIQILIPNGQVWGAALINRSTYDTSETAHISVTLPVALANDPQMVMDRIQDMLAHEPAVLPSPAPSVTLTKVTDSTAEVAVEAWSKKENAAKIREALLRQALMLVAPREPNAAPTPAE